MTIHDHIDASKNEKENEMTTMNDPARYSEIALSDVDARDRFRRAHHRAIDQMLTTLGRWTVVLHCDEYDAALACARGSYQRALLQGRESLSGSTLRGKASRYGNKYALSRDNLLRRMTDANVEWCEHRTLRSGRRVLVIGCAGVAL